MCTRPWCFYMMIMMVNILVMFIIIKIAMASHFHHDLVFAPLCFVFLFKYDGPLSWSPIWVANNHYLQANHVLNEWRDVTTLQSGDASHWNIYQIHETLILEIHDAPPHYKMVMIVTTTMMMFIGTLVADLVNSCHHLQTGGQLALLIRLHHIPTFLCSATRHAEQQAGRGHHKDLL